MNLTPGQRLSSGERSAYDVIEAARRTPLFDFYRARKVFHDFRLAPPMLYESAPDECPDVLIRVPSGGALPDLDFELEHVLPWPEFAGRFPLPVDRIDHPEGSALVLAGLPLGERSPTVDASRFAHEVLEMVERLHRRNLATGVLEPSAFAFDESEGWIFLGTGGVTSSRSDADLAADLTAWGEFCVELLGGKEPDPTTEGGRWLTGAMGRCLVADADGRPRTAAGLLRGGR